MERFFKEEGEHLRRIMQRCCCQGPLTGYDWARYAVPFVVIFLVLYFLQPSWVMFVEDNQQQISYPRLLILSALLGGSFNYFIC